MAPTPTYDEACQLLLQNEDGAVFQAATETLFTLIKNAATADPKYRTLRRSAKGFAERVARAKGGVRFLRAAGFVEQGEGDDAALVLPDAVPAEHLAAARAALKAVVRHRQADELRAREAARAADNAAAAQKLSDLKELSARNTAKQTAEQAAERERLRAGLALDRTDLVRDRDPLQWK
jgi:hypothetical protein